MSLHVVDKVYLDLIFQMGLNDCVSTDIRYDVSRKASESDTMMNQTLNAVTGELHDFT